ncbi:MAG: NAD(P)H-dependent oxidoreductase [Erysipelotrichaceae bacterium]|nr:NAD(P)H-dependent oxidoreductase [Erysipelotrichaceae bacterium]
MKKALFIDCCLRKGSNTKKLAEEFFKELKDYEVEALVLENENLKPLVGEFFESRQELLEKDDRTHPRFRYAYQIKDADLVVIAAPFWDLSFPALLKIYIENISVDGITFGSTEDGLVGLCKANNLIYLTTRGGFYKDDPMEQAIPHLNALSKFFGFKNFKYIAADGMNVQGFDSKKSLEDAMAQARDLAKSL